MNEEEWEALMKSLGRTVRLNQFPYYFRLNNFLVSNNDLEVNQGGMGLGKTLAACIAIKENVLNFDKVFIATPFSSIKTEWVNELNILNLNNYIVWESKLKCCIKKINNPKFDLKRCKDDCEYRKLLQSNQEYSNICYNKLSTLMMPINIDKYYKKDNRFCLVPIIRCGLENRKILVGDYFGFLNSKMYNIMVKVPTQNSVLFIDEAHLIPERACEYLSREIDFKRFIDNIEQEIWVDNIIEKDYHKRLEAGIQILKKIFTNLINIGKTIKNNEGVYTYSDFVSDFEKFQGMGPSLMDFKEYLNKAAKDGFNNQGEYEDKDDPFVRKFWNFLNYWKEKNNHPEYKQKFQYFSYKKNKMGDNISLRIVCFNPSIFLTQVWNRWKRVILLSGTIPEKRYFEDMLGLNNIRTVIESPLDSYSIKEDVLIFPSGDFSSKVRNKTLDSEKDTLINILSALKGRTIIYVLSGDMSILVENQIKMINKKIINFCKDGEEDISQKEFDSLKKEFNQIKEGIGIMSIKGRVEGQNFINEEGDSVENIIIYGYPFALRGLEYDQKVEYWVNQKQDSKAGKEYAEWRPAASKLYQACMRSKRKEEDKPIIILWGSAYSFGCEGYKYLYDELKGQIIYDKTHLLNLIKTKTNERI